MNSEEAEAKAARKAARRAARALNAAQANMEVAQELASSRREVCVLNGLLFSYTYSYPSHLTPTTPHLTPHFHPWNMAADGL